MDNSGAVPVANCKGRHRCPQCGQRAPSFASKYKNAPSRSPGRKKNKASHSGLVGVEELISMTDGRSPLHAKLYTKILLIAINKPPALPTPTAYIEQLTQESVKSAPTA